MQAVDGRWRNDLGDSIIISVMVNVMVRLEKALKPHIQALKIEA